MNHYEINLDKKEFLLFITFKAWANVYLYEEIDLFLLEQLLVLNESLDKRNIIKLNIQQN